VTLLRLGATLALATSLVFAQQMGKPGSKLDRFSLTDLDGAPVAMQTAGKTTAVFFIATQCPISNDYNERMQALVNEYQSKGVTFVFVNSNDTEPAAEVKKHIVDNKFTFPVYKDHDNKFADLLHAEFTPEVFVFDKTGTVVYHGAIDDSRNAANITKRPLKDAFDAVLAGKAVATPEHKAFGCTIKRVKKATE
jgi:thiol-disulfide isomerase/thioredoxin